MLIFVENYLIWEVTWNILLMLSFKSPTRINIEFLLIKICFWKYLMFRNTLILVIFSQAIKELLLKNNKNMDGQSRWLRNGLIKLLSLKRNKYKYYQKGLELYPRNKLNSYSSIFRSICILIKPSSSINFRISEKRYLKLDWVKKALSKY